MQVDLPLNTEDTPSSPSVDHQDLTIKNDEIYWESDDINPNQVIYDLENNSVMVPNSEEELMIPLLGSKKVISRNVGNTRRRRFR